MGSGQSLPFESLDEFKKSGKYTKKEIISGQKIIINNAIIEYLLALRRDPSVCTTRLEEKKKCFSGKSYRDPFLKNDVEKITKEGKRAITELHNHLAKWKGDPGEGNDIGLEHAEALALAAEDHATDIGKTGAASHNGTDRSNFAQRQRRYIKPARISTELIWYGQLDFEKYETLVALVEQGKRIVDDLLIDDGVKDRGHRKALLDCRYQKIGLHIADHLVFGQCLVMECCDDIVETHDLNERKEKGPVKQNLEEQEKIRKQAETTWKVISICARCKKTN
eukprot:g4041.t1